MSFIETSLPDSEIGTICVHCHGSCGDKYSTYYHYQIPISNGLPRAIYMGSLGEKHITEDMKKFIDTHSTPCEYVQLLDYLFGPTWKNYLSLKFDSNQSFSLRSIELKREVSQDQAANAFKLGSMVSIKG